MRIQNLVKNLLLLLIVLLSGCTLIQSPKPRQLLIVTERPIPGIDHLGLAQYPDTFVRYHPDGYAVGVFTQKSIFGDPYNALDRRMAKGGIPLVRYNLRWDDGHNFSTRDFPAIVREAQRFIPLVNKYPLTECEFSGATEHKLGVADAQELAKRVLAVIPQRCRYVNNPWTGHGSFIPTSARIKNEVHGKDAQPPKVGGPFNWSADGSDVFDIDITKLKTRFRDADVLFMWTSQNNGRRNAGDTTPRPQRKFWPTGKLIRAMAFLFTQQGAAKLPPNYLVKPKSDQHSVPPAERELKPVLIFPENVQRLTAKVGSKVIAVSKPREPFVDGRGRYYFSEGYGYEHMKKAGTNLVDIWAGSKKVGTANLGFRQGDFR